MATIPTEDLAFRKWLRARLDPYKHLHPQHELYVPLNENTEHDPIKLICRDICLAELETLNLISGFSGSGKSTELRRLCDNLTAEGFFVVVADASEYFLSTEPVDIDLMLLRLAGAYSDQLQKREDIAATHQSYWARFAQWLKTTDVTIDGVEAKAGIPLTEIESTIKISLKENPSFIEKVKKAFASRPGESRRLAHEFFASASAKVKEKAGAALSPVFILDQFEQIHDTPQSGGNVTSSIVTLVSNHLADLRIPGHHIVLTMPPWLKMLPEGPQNLHLLHGVKLWDNTPERRTNREGMRQMREVVEKRFTPGGLDRFFGPATKNGTRSLVDELIKSSGGHLRDLIILLLNTLLRADDLPVSPKAVRSAINNHRDSFLPLPLAYARLLEQISVLRQCSLPDAAHATIYDFTVLLNAHYAFFMRNDSEWCDIHPLLRDLVTEMISKAAAQQVAAPPAAES